MKKTIPSIREWEGNEKNLFRKFGNGKGMKKIHSRNSGTGIPAHPCLLLPLLLPRSPKVPCCYLAHIIGLVPIYIIVLISEEAFQILFYSLKKYSQNHFCQKYMIKVGRGVPPIPFLVHFNPILCKNTIFLAQVDEIFLQSKWQIFCKGTPQFSGKQI